MWQLKAPECGFFSVDDKRRIGALFEALMPGGSDHPGASDAGAADYLDRLLAMDESTYYEIADWKTMYTAGLPSLAAAAASRFSGRGIDQLSVDETTALLADLGAGRLSGFPSPDWQRRFFGVLRAHCIEGCFADKRWGGNRDDVMWRWYGYPAGPSGAFNRSR